MGKRIKIADVSLGSVFDTENFGSYTVVKINHCNDILIQFHNTGYLRKTSTREMSSGKIKDLLARTVKGVGFIGGDKYQTSYKRKGCKRKPTPAYTSWACRFKSCYADYEGGHIYDGVTICDEWHNFQNFAKWYYEQVSLYGRGGVVDKDLLYLGNKVYGPNTCCYMPQAVNTLFACKGSGISGAALHKVSGLWRAAVSVGLSELTKDGIRKAKHLGCFKQKQDAVEAYVVAKTLHVREVVLKYQDRLAPELFYKLYTGAGNYITYYMSGRELDNEREV